MTPHKRSIWLASASLSLCLLLGATAYAPGVAEGDKGYIQEITGVRARQQGSPDSDPRSRRSIETRAGVRVIGNLGILI